MSKTLDRNGIMNQPRISESGENFCQEVFGHMMEQSHAVYGVLISTVDGHDVTKRFKREMPAAKLAAMMGSVLALGETIAKEAQQERCRYVIVENSDGFILTLKLKEKLVLTVIASADANLGLLHTLSRNAVEKLAKSLR
ncbi:roadblock/LC7 domain-containing protein [Marinobacter sp. HN1S83]|uniref:roadblock/LC7 domain-containing protein n=2 Tax=unclassified Marinobacter TaxID=83889 RepID=UPI00387CA2D3